MHQKSLEKGLITFHDDGDGAATQPGCSQGEWATLHPYWMEIPTSKSIEGGGRRFRRADPAAAAAAVATIHHLSTASIDGAS